MKKPVWQPTLPPARDYKKENIKEILKTSQFIYQAGEYEWLRLKNHPLDPANILSELTQSKIGYIKECFKKFRRITKGKGRGIAAVQLGIPECIFLLYRKGAKNPYQIFINPNITKRSRNKYIYPEACMSCNSLVASVIRPAWVEFNYLDGKGNRQKWVIKDDTDTGRIENRIVQHEIDHLHGILNIDKVKSSELVFEKGKNYYASATFQEVK